MDWWLQWSCRHQHPAVAAAWRRQLPDRSARQRRWPSTVNSLAFGPDGALYVATLAHGLHRVTADGADYKSEPVVLPGGAANEQVNQLASDQARHPWVSAKRGLAVFDGQS